MNTNLEIQKSANETEKENAICRLFDKVLDRFETSETFAIEETTFGLWQEQAKIQLKEEIEELRDELVEILNNYV